MTQKIEWKLWFVGVLMLVFLISLKPLLMDDTVFTILDHHVRIKPDRHPLQDP